MTLEPALFERIRKLVYDRAAIVLEPGKEYLVESRLAPLAQEHGFATVNDLCRALDRQGGPLIAQIVEAMTTNETSFFRDVHPFEALKQTVLPELARQRAMQRRLRIWCAACSTGQEPYSLAMLLDEHFPLLGGWDISIHATDISKAVLSRARAGRFSQLEINRGLNAALLVKYFTRDGLDWELKPSIRRRVQFAEMNLVGRWPIMEKFDLIFLRNVLIYFDQTTKLSILTKVQQHLAGDGFLILGGSETPPAELTSLERVPIARAGIYRVCVPRPSRTGYVR